MSDDGSSLERALHLHRAGRLAEAGELYRAMLESQPDDPDLVGLVGILKLQTGAPAEAERSLTRSVALGGPQHVIVRNLNALAAMYVEAGQPDPARRLLATHLAAMPLTAPNEPREILSVTSLASCALQVGEREIANRLGDVLEQAPTPRTEEGVKAVALLLARLNRPAALATLSEAAREQGGSFPLKLWIECGAIGRDGGHREIVRLAEDRITREHPVYVDPSDPGGQRCCRVLVLNWQARTRVADLAACYHSQNVIGAFGLTNTDERFALDVLLVKDIDPDVIPAQLSAPDVVFNNLANAELNVLEDNTARVSRIARHFGVPVVNDPAAVSLTTRETNYRRLSDIPGVVYPKTVTFFLGEEPLEPFADNLASQFGLPMIVRSVIAHEAGRLFLCRDFEELTKTLAKFRGLYFYGIEFIDCPFEPGLWRKFRIAFLGDAALGHKLNFSDEWVVNVAGWRRLAPSRPDLQEEESRFVRDPLGYVGERGAQALREIRQRIPLDYFGVDFTLDELGRLVVFEANGAMRVLPVRKGGSGFPYLDESRQRIRTALADMLLRRARGGAAPDAGRSASPDQRRKIRP